MATVDGRSNLSARDRPGDVEQDVIDIASTHRMEELCRFNTNRKDQGDQGDPDDPDTRPPQPEEEPEGREQREVDDEQPRRRVDSMSITGARFRLRISAPSTVRGISPIMDSGDQAARRPSKRSHADSM